MLGRNFHTGLGGEVPAMVCDEGPYKYLRHPFYVSYMVAFLSMVVAFPAPVTGAVCLLNIALFIYMAFDDARVLLRSPLAADYGEYRTRDACGNVSALTWKKEMTGRARARRVSKQTFAHTLLTELIQREIGQPLRPVN